MWFALGYAYIGELMFFSFILAGRCRPAALGQKHETQWVWKKLESETTFTSNSNLLTIYLAKRPSVL